MNGAGTSTEGRWKWAVAALCCILTLVVLMQREALVDWWKTKESDKVLAFAKGRIAAGDRATATHVLLENLNEQSGRPEYLRFLGRDLVEQELSEGKTVLDILDRRGQANRGDLGYLAVAQLQAGDLAGAKLAIGRVEDTLEMPWKLWAQAAAKLGATALAADGYDRAVTQRSDDWEALIGLARCGVGGRRVLAVGELLNRAETGGKQASEIADALLGLWTLTKAEEQRLITIMRGLDDRTVKQDLALVYLTTPDVPQRTAQWRQILSVTRAGLEEVADGLRFVQWLGDHDTVIQQTESELRQTSEACGAVRVDSFLAQRKWAEALAISSRAASPLPRPTRDLVEILIGINARKWDAAALRRELFAVFQLSRGLGRTGGYEVIGSLATEHGIPDLAADVFGEALINGPAASSGVDQWLLSARRAGWPLSKIKQTLEWKLGRDSGHIEARKRLLYVQLLEGSSIESAVVEAVALHRKLPQDGLVRLISALGAYRVGDVTGVRSALLPLPRWRWHQGEALVIKQLLNSCGEEKLALSLPLNRSAPGVWPEERALGHGDELALNGP